MKKTLILLIIILTSNLTEAQFIKEKSINAQIGYGISVPYNSIDEVADGGFFAQGELVLKVASWIELSDTLYLGKNVGDIKDYKIEHDDIDYLLTVIIDNEYHDGIVVKDTFSDGTLSPWFGVYANKKDKAIDLAIELEKKQSEK